MARLNLVVLYSMLTNHRVTQCAAAVGVLLLSGCGTTASQLKKVSQGNVIVVAIQDVRSANGRVVSDNAGGIPDALGRAVGVPIGGVAGAVLDVAVGAATNAAANKAVETIQPLELKVISEETCQDWAHIVVRAAVSPQTATLRPGSMARVRQDSASGQMTVVPVTTAADAPAYLAKSHRCYGAWVAEWKEHQRIVRNRMPWSMHRGNDPLFGGVKLSNITDPSYDYIQ